MEKQQSRFLNAKHFMHVALLHFILIDANYEAMGISKGCGCDDGTIALWYHAE